MKITWITRSFLDYRIPVYQEINRLCGNQLTVIYYADVVPQRCQDKLKAIIGERAIGLTGELRLTGKKMQPVSSVTKKGIRIPLQPGLIAAIKKTKPEVLLSDGFFQWTYAALWLRFWKGIPHLMCYEGTKHTERNKGKLRTVYRKLASNYIDFIACNGILCKEYVVSLKYPKTRISLGNMAADTMALQANALSFDETMKQKLKKQLSLNKNVFIFTGRLVTLKGVAKLIEVWIKYFGINSEVSLLIVGDGPEKENLEELCLFYNIPNVCFTGAVDYDNIFKYFAVADIFIIPTLQDNWSLVVPEAMSCGLPVLSSIYNGCWPELVKPDNGWVFDPINPENFNHILQTAWEKREQWKQMGQESLRIVQNYSPQKVAESIYQACLSTLKR